MSWGILFFILFIIGFFIGIGGYYYREKEKKETYHLIETEIVENLKELKSYVTSDEDRQYSKEFDLLEIALTYDIKDITVVNDEGLIIASTLSDAEDVGAIGLGVYEHIKKLYDNNVKKILIQKNDSFIYIYPLNLCKEKIYLIIETKFMLDSLEEKELLRKIYNILKNTYFANIENLSSLESENTIGIS